jgi:hypothetical protein
MDTETIHNDDTVLASLRPQPTSMMISSNVDTDTFGSRIRLKELRVQHRDLDVAIAELIKNPHADQLRVNRLKKQKLRLKDMINRLESELIPDLNA